MSTKNVVLKSVAVAMLTVGMGYTNVALADEVSYGATAFGPSSITVPSMHMHCQTGVYTGYIADPDVLVNFFMHSGLRSVTINHIGSKDASRIFDTVNGMNGVRATYTDSTNTLVLENLMVRCGYCHHHMGYVKPHMMGVISDRVSGDSVISSGSQAHGFVASTSSMGSYIYDQSPTIMASDYQTGEGETPLYTR